MSLIVEQSILGFCLNPELRATFNNHLQPWMFKTDWAGSFLTCLQQPAYDGVVPNMHEFIAALHNLHKVSQADCEAAANVFLDYNESSARNPSRIIDHVQEWIREAYLTSGLEVIASGNEKDYRSKGIELVSTGISFQLGVDEFDDFTDDAAVEAARQEDLPPNGAIIPSSYSVINRSLSYKGYKYGDLIMVTAESGVGKCHAKDEGILLYNGSIKMSQDIQVGDQLMGPDSQPRTVLSLARGRDLMYRVTTTKGDSFIVNQQHRLWVKETTRQGGKWTSVADVAPKDITIEEFLSRPFSVQKNKIKLLKSSVDYAAASHIISPYFMGLQLGDGSLQGTSVSVYTADAEVVQEIYAEADRLHLNVRDYAQRGCRKYKLASNTSVRHNPILIENRRLGIQDTNCFTKTIPNEYLVDSRKNRLGLLAGLIDSDGYYNERGNFYEFSSVSHQLAHQVLRLARSLGFGATLSTGTINSQYIRSTTRYRVHISGALDQVPCRITRKQARTRQINKDVLHHGIASIEPLGLGDYYGWQVDGDHLYLDDDYITHHNSTVLITESAHFLRMGFRVAHIVLGDLSRFDVYAKYMANLCDVDFEEILATGHTQYAQDPTFRDCMSRLRVKVFDPDTHDIYQLIAKVGRLRQKFEFDVLIVDYDGNIKDASNSGSSYIEGGAIYANLKGYGRKRCVVFVAAQTKIQYWGEEIILKNFANDSSKKQHHLDLMIGVGPNKEFRGVGTLNLAKVRRGIADRRTRVAFEGNRSRIVEISQAEYDKRIQRHKLNSTNLSYDYEALLSGGQDTQPAAQGEAK